MEQIDIAYDPLAVPLKHRVGAAAAKKLASLGLDTIGDALNYAPRRYFHWGKLTNLADLTEGEEVTVLAKVQSQTLLHNRSGKGVRLQVTISDGVRFLNCTFFAKNEYALTHHRRLLQIGESFLFAGKVSSYRDTLQLVQPSFEEIETDSPEAVARRSGRPIPVYRAKANLPSWKIQALITAILEDIDWKRVPEIVPEAVRAEHGLLSRSEAYLQLHQPDDDTAWQSARRSLAWGEALVLQAALLRPRFEAEKKGKQQATPLLGNDTLVSAALSHFPYQLTRGQNEAWEVISTEMAQPLPMQRLLQADVGAGKTVVALLAMLRAVESGYQAALLAPTSVLATQHYASFVDLLGQIDIEVPVHLLTGSVTGAQRNEILARLAAGEPGIVIGTHALIQDGVDISRLALLVVDEQHRFGVAQREKLREGRQLQPHLLVMTATPIPRTIAMTVFGELDVIEVTDMPPGRTPVETFLVSEDNAAWMDRLWQRAREEIAAGGRVYVVCPRIEAEAGEGDKAPLPSIEEVVPRLEKLPQLEDIEMAVAHGQMSLEHNRQALSTFASGATPLLVATTVIEVGVDVPEATMMVILGAGQFGLSQLHQLRGRVGRSDHHSVCMLVHGSDLTAIGADRLRALERYDSGFALAEVDLQLRKEGDVLGESQAGTNSSLRFLSVRHDGAIIASARSVAEEYLGSDPQLGAYPGWQQAVSERARTELVWLERN